MAESNFEYNDSLRKNFHKVCCTNITDIESIAKLLKSRAYRGDLMGENASAFGNIDIKLFAESNDGQVEFRAISGPLFYNTPNNQKLVISSQLLHDESLVDDDQLSEFDMFTERRSARDDIRAIAKTKTNGPFKWSNTKLDATHSGHPDVWNFEHVSPTWAWQFEKI